MFNKREEIYSLYKQLERTNNTRQKIGNQIKEKIKIIQKETLPEGYVIREIVSYYWGSHPEYEGDKIATLAMPKDFPEFEVSHGSSGEKEFKTLDGKKFSEEILNNLYIWDTSCKLKWESFSSDLIGDPYWEVEEDDEDTD